MKIKQLDEGLTHVRGNDNIEASHIIQYTPDTPDDPWFKGITSSAVSQSSINRHEINLQSSDYSEEEIKALRKHDISKYQSTMTLYSPMNIFNKLTKDVSLGDRKRNIILHAMKDREGNKFINKSQFIHDTLTKVMGYVWEDMRKRDLLPREGAELIIVPTPSSSPLSHEIATIFAEVFENLRKHKRNQIDTKRNIRLPVWSYRIMNILRKKDPEFGTRLRAGKLYKDDNLLARRPVVWESKSMYQAMVRQYSSADDLEGMARVVQTMVPPRMQYLETLIKRWNKHLNKYMLMRSHHPEVNEKIKVLTTQIAQAQEEYDYIKPGGGFTSYYHQRIDDVINTMNLDLELERLVKRADLDGLYDLIENKLPQRRQYVTQKIADSLTQLRQSRAKLRTIENDQTMEEEKKRKKITELNTKIAKLTEELPELYIENTLIEPNGIFETWCHAAAERIVEAGGIPEPGSMDPKYRFQMKSIFGKTKRMFYDTMKLHGDDDTTSNFVHRPSLPPGSVIILVDDNIDTNRTVTDIYRILFKAGIASWPDVKVMGLALHTMK